MGSLQHIPGLSWRAHRFACPRDHARPKDGNIEVYAREVCAAGRENSALPYLVFLQGGPGFASPRPASLSGWIRKACERYRVLLLDQRGTGHSSPLNFQTLAQKSPTEQADELVLYRADSIVQDAEFIRRQLIGKERWSVLGQSFGGFCATHYLCAAPEGLAGVMITGGLPSLHASADEVYRRTFALVSGRNRRYYERYPEDVDRVGEISSYLAERDVRLPASGALSPRRFQTLGLRFGMSSGFEAVHYLIEEAFLEGAEGRELAYLFLREFENFNGFDCHPLFSILHESIYAQEQPTRWAAHRVRAEFPEFDPGRTDGPVYFTGEMIFPWMFDEVETLIPLKESAERLAHKEDWPILYDATVLAKNSVPCAALIYAEDMYVSREFSEETARAIRGCKVWTTNELEHDGIRVDGGRVLSRLLDMLHARV